MEKNYVLVPEDEYERMFGDPEEAQQPKKSKQQTSLPNPFQNPDVKEAKQTRQALYDVVTDKSVPADRVDLFMKAALNAYQEAFRRATGKRKSGGGWYASDPVKPPQTKKKKPTEPINSSNLVKQRTDSPEKVAQTPVRPKSKKKDIRQVYTPPAMRQKHTGGNKPQKTYEGADDVARALGGHWNKADARRASTLLNKMQKADLMVGDNFKVVQDEGFKATPVEMRNIIRDLLTSDPSRRSTAADKVDGFRQMLTRRGVDWNIDPNAKRTGARKKNK